MLSLRQLDSFYGSLQILRQINLDLHAGEVLCLFGRNGAGKTTILKSVMGLMTTRGVIELNGSDISQLPAHKIPQQGIGYVPQGRRLFAELTVAENLQIGLMAKGTDDQVREGVLHLFPVLNQRLKQVAGTLSGGEQQMLAMARALCLEPKVLLLDEPTEGLMPSMIATIREAVLELRTRGVAILLVEQRVEAVLPVADRIAFIENGEKKAEINRDEITDKSELLNQYVGVSHTRT